MLDLGLHCEAGIDGVLRRLVVARSLNNVASCQLYPKDPPVRIWRVGAMECEDPDESAAAGKGAVALHMYFCRVTG